MEGGPAVEKVWGDNVAKLGCGCGSVGKAVASDTRDPQLESSHRHKFFLLSTVFKLC